MIVVTANWAFTDGSLVAHDRQRIAAWFTSLRRAVLRAGWSRDGSYRPLDRVDLVLAGDTFDWLTSAAWGEAARPWHGGRRAAELRRQVMAASATHAADFLGPLQRLVRRGVVMPTSDRRGRPRLDATTTVPVRVTCLVGDRDPWLDEAAAWIAARGGAVGTTWADATVTIAHGAEFDPICFDPEPAAGSAARDRGRAPTLRESLAVDLGVRFAVALRADGRLGVMGDRLTALVTAHHPLEWQRVLAGRLDAVATAERRHVVDAWRRAVDAWRREVGRSPPAWDAPGCPWDDLASQFAGDPAANAPAAAWHAPAMARRARAGSAGAAAPGLFVLGHPSGDGVLSAPHDGRQPMRRTVCLGMRPMRRWGPVGVVGSPAATAVTCVGALPAGAGPASVVIRADDDAPTVEWLDGETDPADQGISDAADGCVVDAA